jgi:hypothetical protein
MTLDESSRSGSTLPPPSSNKQKRPRQPPMLPEDQWQVARQIAQQLHEPLYSVLIGLKQWAKVEAALLADENDIVVTEGVYAFNKQLGDMAVTPPARRHATCSFSSGRRKIAKRWQ